ncbi:hypothetical protein CMI37_02460 [Candidatus Pacearchaeota archaeon]|nr:hypothetical protein [Candidatus Pacearchaeota archaeon]|tara:strand:+ start:11303 stop:11887 length:585 start_codon:yes stop_codon:yes gene_type:complete
MALYLNFNIKQSDNARELAFTETTGAYNGSTNPGGWGTPNPAIADVTTSARLSITPPGGTATIINVSTTHPTVDKTIEVVIRSQDIGLGTDTILPDGLWEMSYYVEDTVAVPNVTYTNDQTIFVSGQARCCVYGLLADIDISCCDCDGSDMARALEAFTYYRAAIACAACGNTSKFTDALGIVNNYCDIKCKCD